MAVEPPPSRWVLPDASEAHDSGVVAMGGDLEPGTLLAAYRSGLFPMPGDTPQRLLWWSPDPRGVLDPQRFHASRSLHRSRRRFTVSVDTCFRAVVEQCATLPRTGQWITPVFVDAYVHLHELGWAHSVEVHDDGGALVGGLYGVAIGGLFAGESMFHLATDASKVALWAAVDLVSSGGGTLFDVQWTTPHLRSLGATDIRRSDYLRRLDTAVGSDTTLFASRWTTQR